MDLNMFSHKNSVNTAKTVTCCWAFQPKRKRRKFSFQKKQSPVRFATRICDENKKTEEDINYIYL